MADEDQPVRVVALRAGRNLDRRLTDLGLNIGSQLRVLQRQGSSVVVTRGQTRIAIGGGMAMKILVVPDAQPIADDTPFAG
jgi:ferrous iron transport protein A